MAKYVDLSATIQVIGCIYQNPSLLDDERYFFNEDDFTEEFHKILFGSIYNLHQLGAKQISIEDIEKYLEQRPKKYAVYKVNKGSEYLENIKEMCQLAAFDYYFCTVGVIYPAVHCRPQHNDGNILALFDFLHSGKTV